MFRSLCAERNGYELMPKPNAHYGNLTKQLFHLFDDFHVFHWIARSV